MSRFVMPLQSAFGQNVKPFDGSKLFFFESGTNTPKDTFSDSTLTTPNANPVIADSSGRFPSIFLNGDYKSQLKDKNDVQIWEEEISSDEEIVGIQLFDDTITQDTTIPAGKNALSVDPTITSGVTVTVTSGQTWAIV